MSRTEGEQRAPILFVPVCSSVASKKDGIHTRKMANRSASYKVVLLGEGRVGKTSLVLRFCRDTFVDGQPPTIQASCLERALRLGDKTVNLVIWDTAGQERFHALGPIYYRDADAALLVYDITDTDSFKRIQVWVRELRKMVGDSIQLSIAGNKSDLERQRVVSRQEAAEYADSVGAHYAETSAKQNRGLDELFSSMGKRLLASREEKLGSPALGSGPASTRRSRGAAMVLIDDEPPTSSSSSRCC